MIQVECGHCGKTLEVDETHAGKVGFCTKCGGEIGIPIPTPPKVSTEDKLAPEKELFKATLRYRVAVYAILFALSCLFPPWLQSTTRHGTTNSVAPRASSLKPCGVHQRFITERRIQMKMG
jgi:rRNA maturation protein Nop10